MRKINFVVVLLIATLCGCGYKPDDELHCDKCDKLFAHRDLHHANYGKKDPGRLCDVCFIEEGGDIRKTKQWDPGIPKQVIGVSWMKSGEGFDLSIFYHLQSGELTDSPPDPTDKFLTELIMKTLDCFVLEYDISNVNWKRSVNAPFGRVLTVGCHVEPLIKEKEQEE